MGSVVPLPSNNSVLKIMIFVRTIVTFIECRPSRLLYQIHTFDILNHMQITFNLQS